MGGIGEDGEIPGPRTAAGWASREAQLSEDAVRVFRWVSDQGSCDARTLGATLGLPETRAASAVTTLTELLLLRHPPGNPEELVAVAPDEALAALVAPRRPGCAGSSPRSTGCGPNCPSWRPSTRRAGGSGGAGRR